MPDLGNAYVNIVPKAPGIKNNISGLLGGSDASAGAGQAGESLGKKLLGTFAKLGIGMAVGKTIKDAFSAGGNLEQSFGGLDTIYGDAAAAAKEYAQAAASAGISSNNYAEQAVSFGAALKKAYGDDAKAMEAANTAILDMADNAAKMGTPLESIQNAYQGFAKQNYTMLDNLKLGYGGTQKEMERLLADAQKVTGVKYDIKNLGDVYDAIHVIQGELGLTGVAADEAKTTLTGSMGAVKASWENLLAAMTTGEGLDSALTNLAASAGNLGQNVLRMLSSLAGQLPSAVSGLITQLLPQMAPLAGQLIGGLVDGLFTTLPELMTAFGGLIRQAVDWIRKNAVTFTLQGVHLVQDLILGITQGSSGVFSAAGEILTTLVDALIASAKVLLIAGGNLLGNVMDGIVNALPQIAETALSLISSLSTAIMDNLPQLLSMGITMLQNLISGIVSALPGLLDTALSIITALTDAILDNLPQIVSMGVDLLSSLLDGIVEALPQIATTIGTVIGELLGNLLEHLPELLQSGIEILGAIIEGILSAIVSLVSSLPQVWASIKESCAGIDWAQLGKDIINGIINGLGNAASALWKKMKEIIKGGLKAAQDEAKISSPSRLFADELGRWIPAGVAMGIDENMSPLDRAMQGMVDGSLANAQGFRAQPAAAAAGSDADRIIDALQRLQVRADVSLEGDARGLFKVVQKTNLVRTKATSYNALAAGG